MELFKTKIIDLLIVEQKVFQDSRGYFFESYNQKKAQELGLNYNFIQDNQSFSTYGTLRGLHLQTGEMAQAKLVRVIHGKVLDVAVDLRPGSKTFGEHFSIELSGENHLQLMIPRGFAHGFVVLSETAIFAYKVDNTYSKEHEGGIIWNDSKLNIDWKLPHSEIELSAKDKILPAFNPKDYQ